MEKQLDERYNRFGASGPHWVLMHWTMDDWGEPGLVGFCGHPHYRSESASTPISCAKHWPATERKLEPPSNQGHSMRHQAVTLNTLKLGEEFNGTHDNRPARESAI